MIPGWGTLHVAHVVLDLNGTITESGELIPGVSDYLTKLDDRGVTIVVLSGDTRDTLHSLFQKLERLTVHVTKTAEDKRAFVDALGPEKTVCIGNGNIDLEMFRTCALSICTVQAEGASVKAMVTADIVVNHIAHALDILLDPEKLIATLRS
jgi:soluble P-type ATPase